MGLGWWDLLVVPFLIWLMILLIKKGEQIKKKREGQAKVKDDIVLFKARKGCKKCYGRGIVGVNDKTKKKVLCSCAIVRKIERKVAEDAVKELIAAGMKENSIKAADIIKKIDNVK